MTLLDKQSIVTKYFRFALASLAKLCWNGVFTIKRSKTKSICLFPLSVFKLDNYVFIKINRYVEKQKMTNRRPNEIFVFGHLWRELPDGLSVRANHVHFVLWQFQIPQFHNSILFLRKNKNKNHGASSLLCWETAISWPARTWASRTMGRAVSTDDHIYVKVGLLNKMQI